MEKEKDNITLENAIDSVSDIKINSENIIRFHTIMFSIIRNSGDLYFGVNHDLNTIVIFNTLGAIQATIEVGEGDKLSPKRIDFFDIHPTKPYVYVLDGIKQKIFVYTFDGILEKVLDYPDNATQYYKIFYYDDENFVLQRKPQSSDVDGLRKEGVVGALFNHKQNKLSLISMMGGSAARDLNINYGLDKSSQSILFHYNSAPEIFKVDNDKLVERFFLNGNNMPDQEILNEIDKSPAKTAHKVFRKLYETPNAISIRYVYEVNEILFITYFEGQKFRWMFYNKKLDKAKITTVDSYNVSTAKKAPIKHNIHNAKGNMLMIFVDGEALQNNKEFKETYDPNSTYLLKIYPKYLNQSAWE